MSAGSESAKHPPPFSVYFGGEAGQELLALVDAHGAAFDRSRGETIREAVCFFLDAKLSAPDVDAPLAAYMERAIGVVATLEAWRAEQPTDEAEA